MKKTLILILALALLLTLAGCGLASAPAPSTEPAPTEEPAPAAEPVPEEEPAPAEEPVPETDELPAAFEPAFRFSTTTLDGTAADESIFAGHTLTMINFFEPWCPPCIAELPDLEKLYETYAPEGFQILGVFSTEEGTAEVVSDAALSYPVLRYVPEFDQFQTGYVPTTIFVDGSGRIVGETQIGSNSYAGWEAIVKDLMG